MKALQATTAVKLRRLSALPVIVLIVILAAVLGFSSPLALSSQNLVNILTLMTTTSEDGVGSFTPDFEDEIVAGSCVTHDGEVRHEATREALSGGPA